MVLMITIVSFSGFVTVTQISIGNPELCRQEAAKHTHHMVSGRISNKQQDKNGYTSYTTCIKQAR